MGWDGMGWDGMGWDGMGWRGISSLCGSHEVLHAHHGWRTEMMIEGLARRF